MLLEQLGVEVIEKLFWREPTGDFAHNPAAARNPQSSPALEKAS
jgi:hypothetical protein